MTKKDDEDFKKSTKCWICDNGYVGGDVKVRDHCHITGKYPGSTHWDCYIKVKLNLKTPVVFHNLNNYHSYFIMQELVKLDFNINVTQNGFQK